MLELELKELAAGVGAKRGVPHSHLDYNMVVFGGLIIGFLVFICDHYQ